MVREWEVRWEGELPAGPQDVWDAITKHSDGYLWAIEYEPRLGGAERGLTAGGGTVTAWDPPRHFATRTRPETERDGINELDFRLEPLGPVTYLRYVHRAAVPADDFDRQLAACRAHTTFYNHSLGQYACHFAGRQAAYVSVDGPEESAQGGFVGGAPRSRAARRRRRRRPRSADAGRPRPDRRRRRLRDRLVPRHPQRRRALPRLRARHVGLAGRRRAPPVRRRSRPGGGRAGVGGLDGRRLQTERVA